MNWMFPKEAFEVQEPIGLAVVLALILSGTVYAAFRLGLFKPLVQRASDQLLRLLIIALVALVMLGAVLGFAGYVYKLFLAGRTQVVTVPEISAPQKKPEIRRVKGVIYESRLATPDEIGGRVGPGIPIKFIEIGVASQDVVSGGRLWVRARDQPLPESLDCPDGNAIGAACELDGQLQLRAYMRFGCDVPVIVGKKIGEKCSRAAAEIDPAKMKFESTMMLMCCFE
ncbi:hypothetical protein [Lysobacter enzymogenes]|uniref:hypothetical protein n=1 Tax=Lysobacter enzymogenes TaxID=69 RepID=UPI001AF780DD|nr:hypothetical protein [Lysobacter enzymogenes]QQQ02904.1 hypothetical protein JHW41_08070 [Lysobacter enzymogenes]